MMYGNLSRSPGTNLHPAGWCAEAAPAEQSRTVAVRSSCSRWPAVLLELEQRSVFVKDCPHRQQLPVLVMPTLRARISPFYFFHKVQFSIICKPVTKVFLSLKLYFCCIYCSVPRCCWDPKESLDRDGSCPWETHHLAVMPCVCLVFSRELGSA